MKPALALALLLPCVAAGDAAAAESYDNCRGFVTSLPATLTAPVTYCLKQNLSTPITSGEAILVTVNNVTIDCNGYRIVDQAGTATQAVGIRADSRANLTLRNCVVRGFHRGLETSGSGSSGHVIEDNRFEINRKAAMVLVGSGHHVRRNLLVDNGGMAAEGETFGIVAHGDVDIVDNTIDGVNPVGDASGRRWSTGIRTANNLAGTVSGNRVRSLVASGGGIEVGIDNIGNDAVVMSDNIVNGRGTPGSYGLRCADPSGVSVRNVVLRFPNGLGGCADGGGNVVGD